MAARDGADVCLRWHAPRAARPGRDEAAATLAKAEQLYRAAVTGKKKGQDASTRGKKNKKLPKLVKRSRRRGSGRVNPSAPWAWTRLSWASKCVLAVACRHAVPHILCTPCVTWRLRLLLRLRVCAGRALPPPRAPTRTQRQCTHAHAHEQVRPCCRMPPYRAPYLVHAMCCMASRGGAGSGCQRQRAPRSAPPASAPHLECHWQAGQRRGRQQRRLSPAAIRARAR